MTGRENELLELDSLIESYKIKLKAFEEKMLELEEDLGDIKTYEDAEETKKNLASIEQKKHLLENHIFTLDIKKAELRYAQKDNSKKNTLARNSMIASIVLSVIIIALTYFQVQTNYDLVALGVADSLIQKGQIELRLQELEATCRSSLKDVDQKLFDKADQKITLGLQDLQTRLAKLQKDVEIRIEKLKSE